MSVSEQIPIVAYIANGTTSRFPITFDLQDARYLDVLLNKEVAQIASYTVENNTSVVFSTPPKVGDEIILSRSTTLERETNFDNYDNSFRPETINWDLDKIWHKLQEDHVTDAYFLARLKSELETRRTADSLLQHQIDILNEVLLGVFENASSTYLADKLRELEKSLEDAINIAAASGAGSEGWTDLLILTADGVTTQRALNAKTVKNGEYAPVLGAPVKLIFDPSKFSLRYGLSDPLPLDNNTNMFRGLTNKNAWADENIGSGSVAFGRNGASVAYLTTTFGHDCITYGVASTAGGAGSGTGNPDAPTDGANYGYCSFAHGKDTAAIGRISTAFGQECKATSIHSYASGMQSETGPGLTSHPNGVASDGDCAWAHGYRAKAYGDFSAAFGSFITAYNSGVILGRGINPGSPLIANDALVLGYGVDVPTIALKKGNGANGGFGKLGINTATPLERVEIRTSPGDKIAIRSDKGVGGVLDLQSTTFSEVTLQESPASIFRIEYTSPNVGSAFGVTTLYQNNNKFMTIDEAGDPTFNRILNSIYGYQVGGTRVIGGQQSAIADSTGTAADNQRAINAILAALRGHGLIAP